MTEPACEGSRTRIRHDALSGRRAENPNVGFVPLAKETGSRAKVFPSASLTRASSPQSDGPTMRIHHVTPHYAPEVGGLEDSVARFASWQARTGHHVVVHTSVVTTSGKSLPMEDRFHGVLVKRYATEGGKGYYRTWFRPRIEDADLVHLHGYAVRTNDVVAASLAGTPFVYSLHHGVRMPHPTSVSVLRWAYDRFRGLPTLRRAARVLVASRGDLPWLERRGIPSSKIRHLPTPLADEAFLPGDRLRGRALAGRDRFFLYLGRLHAEKGVVETLDAIARIPDARLVYAGPDAGMRPSLQARAAAHGMIDRVSILGFVPEAAKRDLLAATTALVLPSTYEAQGIVVLEAWAQGRPVVATHVGALAEIVVQGRTGLLVPRGDVDALTRALRRLSSGEADGEAMGAMGRTIAAGYRLDVLAPRLEAIYREITG